eukprot:TRINITY_DN12584_c0_g1_i1.p2 TRINITY_DN12584_c0_g1~~TRINITY_DN12584_c0_g1_i1.p2  ORF type:complete len:110 (-),score=36.75 TRINITY_DN12584_c0_g1_i1:31-360(-)
MTAGMCGAASQPKLTDMWEDDAPAVTLKPAASCSRTAQTGCVYEDALFEQRAVQWIKAHNPSTPLFMVYAPHAVHTPLAPTAAQLKAFSFIKDSTSRQMYAATVQDIDT